MLLRHLLSRLQDILSSSNSWRRDMCRIVLLCHFISFIPFPLTCPCHCSFVIMRDGGARLWWLRFLNFISNQTISVHVCVYVYMCRSRSKNQWMMILKELFCISHKQVFLLPLTRVRTDSHTHLLRAVSATFTSLTLRSLCTARHTPLTNRPIWLPAMWWWCWLDLWWVACVSVCMHVCMCVFVCVCDCVCVCERETECV